MRLFKWSVLGFLFLFSTLYTESKPFVVGTLTGQLGNQLFVIAATISLALDNDAIPVFPDLVHRREDNTSLNYREVFHRLNTNLPPNQHIESNYQEPHFHYAPIPYRPNMCLVGYFQSEKYFKHHKHENMDLFKPDAKIVEYLQNKYGGLLSHQNTVSIHMRSYHQEDPENKFYMHYGARYFKNAMSMFPKDTLFLIFSNRMDLAKKEFENIPGRFFFVEGETHYHDFYLMSMCKHNIITNSSFSWWAAYLNPNPEKIIVRPLSWIAPWYATNYGLDGKDLYPEEWIMVSDK
jgi:hypothetical protein